MKLCQDCKHMQGVGGYARCKAIPSPIDGTAFIHCISARGNGACGVEAVLWERRQEPEPDGLPWFWLLTFGSAGVGVMFAVLGKLL